MKNIGIIGSGTMGSGIAQVAATSGCKVKVFDTQKQALVYSDKKLRSVLERLVEKERISEEKKDSILANIQYVQKLEDLSDSDLIIEAIIEDVSIKEILFNDLSSRLTDTCIVASNTSSLSISQLASFYKIPENFIGIHFFNPAALMKLVEIIPAIQTDKKVLEDSRSAIKAWGKTTVVAKDTPGFIVNKVARPFYSEALRIFEEGLAGTDPETSFATIDWAMTEIAGFRMGPFTLMDFIGNDVNYAVTESVFRSFYYDPRYKPSFTQKRLSEAGYWGRKTGRGYYTYDKGSITAEALKDEQLGREIADRIVVMLINEAADTLHNNIASMKDIELAMTQGVNYPKGLFKWADELGISACVDKIDALYDWYHEDRYRCSPLLRKMALNNSSFYS
ncbi:MAG: 3-hydroxybutyryl-CoA dehydrogenase [Chitinophagia bacterium]|nr:3-hydroxybutyryl-CoA dehydrogenase [Chitinophagia bacterium]